MNFDIITRQIDAILRSKGWESVVNIQGTSIIFKNSFLFDEEIEILFPINTNVVDFPAQLLASLQSIVSLHPDLTNHITIRKTVAYSKNIKQKYSKTKDKWILHEPNAKYNLNEIPDIYIPNI